MEEAVLKSMSLTARFNPVRYQNRSLLLLSGNIKVTGIGHRRKLGATSRCRLADLLYGMETGEQPYELLASYEIGSNASLFSPQGGLRASTDDLLLVLQMLYNGGVTNQTRILSEAWLPKCLRMNGCSTFKAAMGFLLEKPNLRAN